MLETTKNSPELIQIWAKVRRGEPLSDEEKRIRNAYQATRRGLVVDVYCESTDQRATWHTEADASNMPTSRWVREMVELARNAANITTEQFEAIVAERNEARSSESELRRQFAKLSERYEELEARNFAHQDQFADHMFKFLEGRR